METNSLKVLLIEDDKFLRKAAEATLHRHRFVVLTATNGEEGLKLAQTGAPDLILLDLIMPKVNGFEVLRTLKSEPATAQIPVIVLTNLGQQKSSSAKPRSKKSSASPCNSGLRAQAPKNPDYPKILIKRGGLSGEKPHKAAVPLFHRACDITSPRHGRPRTISI